MLRSVWKRVFAVHRTRSKFSFVPAIRRRTDLTVLDSVQLLKSIFSNEWLRMSSSTRSYKLDLVIHTLPWRSNDLRVLFSNISTRAKISIPRVPMKLPANHRWVIFVLNRSIWAKCDIQSSVRVSCFQIQPLRSRSVPGKDVGERIETRFRQRYSMEREHFQVAVIP